MTQNDLTIISKPHAHPHTMKKTYAKFQNNQYKTVRGVAFTRGTQCLYIKGEKWLSSQCGKSNKQCFNNYTQTTCTSSFHEENLCKVSKQSVQNLRGIALTRGTHYLYIEGEKWQCGKSDKTCSNNYTQTTCTSSYHEENTHKVSKQSV